MIKKIRLAKLDMDYDLYPREHLDNYHVEEIVEAIKAGVHLPPITVDQSTYKVVDGWHRIEAARKLWGDKATIQAELKEYPSKAAMFEEAIRLNASHGRALSKMDEAHCLAKAENFKLEPAVVASLLNITMQRAAELTSKRLAESDDGAVVLKGSTAHLAGRKLTDEQVNYNRRAGGLHQSFYINQVIAMVESDSVDWDDDRITKGLQKLLELLEESLKTKV
jgi:hypothetical protein